jgi:hypothetical protein
MHVSAHGNNLLYLASADFLKKKLAHNLLSSSLVYEDAKIEIYRATVCLSVCVCACVRARACLVCVVCVFVCVWVCVPSHGIWVPVPGSLRPDGNCAFLYQVV